MLPGWLYCQAGSDLCVEQTATRACCIEIFSCCLLVHVGSWLSISGLHFTVVSKRQTQLAWGFHILSSGIHSYLHLEGSDHWTSIDPFSQSFVFVTCTFLLILKNTEQHSQLSLGKCPKIDRGENSGEASEHIPWLEEFHMHKTGNQATLSSHCFLQRFESLTLKFV